MRSPFGTQNIDWSCITRFMLVSFFLISVGLAAENGLFGAAQELCDQIRDTFKTAGETQKPKIAVLEFSDLSGRVTDDGRLLSEELITRLFLTRQFEVVERLMLAKVIEEHKLQMSGIVDPASAKQLGKILGVDAIVAGTLARTTSGVRVNARVISTDTGSVLAVAAATVGAPQAGPPGEETTAAGLLPPGPVFSEDFSGVAFGRVPEGWLAPNEVMVKKAGGEKGLYAEPAGSYSVYIPTGSFPEDFRLTFKLQASWGLYLYAEPVQIVLGNLVFLFDARGSVKTGNSKGSFSSVQGQKALVVVQKEGELIRFIVNGTEALLLRRPDYSVPDGVTIKWTNKWTKSHYMWAKPGDGDSDRRVGWNNCILYQVTLDRL